MKRKASFHPVAQQELIEAALWYDEQRPGLGDEFIDTVVARVNDLRDDPQRFPTAYGDVQQAILRRFPFAIYYRNMEDRILVLSVFHSSRNPESLQDRFDS